MFCNQYVVSMLRQIIVWRGQGGTDLCGETSYISSCAMTFGGNFQVHLFWKSKVNFFHRIVRLTFHYLARFGHKNFQTQCRNFTIQVKIAKKYSKGLFCDLCHKGSGRPRTTAESAFFCFDQSMKIGFSFFLVALQSFVLKTRSRPRATCIFDWTCVCWFEFQNWGGRHCGLCSWLLRVFTHSIRIPLKKHFHSNTFKHCDSHQNWRMRSLRNRSQSLNGYGFSSLLWLEFVKYGAEVVELLGLYWGPHFGPAFVTKNHKNTNQECFFQLEIGTKLGAPQNCRMQCFPHVFNLFEVCILNHEVPERGVFTNICWMFPHCGKINKESDK